MTIPRESFGIAVHQNKIYMIGGKYSSGWIDNTNEAYDPTTDTWTIRTPIPTPVGFYASAVFNNRIYVIGGYKGSD